MESLFDVNKYRNYLESFFVHGYDKDTVLERKNMINKYSDEFLQKIIDDTTIFIIYVMDRMKSENHRFDERIFVSLGILDDSYQIHNGCIGGASADELYYPVNFEANFMVSRYLLKQFFTGFSIDVTDEVTEYYDEIEEAGSIYFSSNLFISGPVKKFEELSQHNVLKQKKGQELTKILRLIRDKKQNLL